MSRERCEGCGITYDDAEIEAGYAMTPCGICARTMCHSCLHADRDECFKCSPEPEAEPEPGDKR